MKHSRFLAVTATAVACAFASPSAEARTGPTPAPIEVGAKAKDAKKSPASREISNAEYDLKNLRRRMSRDNWKKSVNTRKSARKVIAKVRKAFAEVKKKDPSWNIRKQTAELDKYERMVDAEEKKAGVSSKEPGKSTLKADTMDVNGHPAASKIRSARMFMRSLRKKIAAKKYVKDDRLRRDMARDIANLRKTYFPGILKKDRAFPIGPWKKELKQFDKALDKANAADAARKKEIDDAIKLLFEYKEAAERNLFLDLLYGVSKGKYRTGHYEWMQQRVDDLDVWAKSFARKCKTRKYEDIPQSKFRKERNYPKVTCKLARDYKKWALKYVDKNAKTEVKALVKDQKKAIATLTKSGAITPGNYGNFTDGKGYVDRYFKKYDRYYRKFGGRAKRSTFEPLAGQKGQFDAAMKTAASKSRFPKDARYFEPTMAPAAKRKLKGAKLLQAKSISSSWKIKKNAVGTPLSKERWGFIMTKATGESFCRVNQGEVWASYKGGGRYTNPVWKWHNNHFFVSACR